MGKGVRGQVVDVLIDQAKGLELHPVNDLESSMLRCGFHNGLSTPLCGLRRDVGTGWVGRLL
jgi:hypothetical protein